MSSCLRLVLFSLCLLAPACGVEEGIVARVSQQRVVVERVQEYLEAVTGMPWQDVDMRVASRLLDQFLEQEAILEYLSTDKFPPAVDPSRRWTLVQQYATEEWGPAPQVSDAEVQREVDTRITQVLPEQVYLRQMLFPDLETAEEVSRRLAEGEEFVVLSRELSRAPNADRGGELGWVVMGSQPDEIEDIIFSLAENEVSHPVRGPGGFHLFQALEVRSSGPPPRHRLEAQVRKDLEVAQERRHYQWCVDQALRSVGVEVYPENLWFEYEGRFSERSDAKK